MKTMFSGGIKGLGALLTVWVAYIDKTFTPLIWALLLLVFLDILMNIHKEGQQFAKLGSAVMTLGIPSFVANNLVIPDLGKYLVAMMVIVYLQLVVPQVVNKMAAWSFSKDPKQNAIDQAIIDAAVQKAVDAITKDAQAVIDSTKQAGTGPAHTPGNDGGNGGA